MFAITIIAIGAGGALGALARYGAGLLAVVAFGGAFSWGTMIVNIVGSLVMGGVAAYVSAVPSGLSDAVRLGIMTGFLGAFTTFSAFSLDFMRLWTRGDMAQAFLYAGGSVIACLAAVFIGAALIKQWV